jgi:hypothetical protein
LTIIDGFKIVNGLNGIYLEYANPKLMNLIIRDNAESGVRMTAPPDKKDTKEGERLIMRNCNISHNGERGIFGWTGFVGTLDMTDCVVDSNTFAGIRGNSFLVDFKRCTFMGNDTAVTLRFSGGTVDSCEFRKNNESVTLEETDLTITNSGFYDGGGLSSIGLQGFTVTDCLFHSLSNAIAGYSNINESIIRNCEAIGGAIGISDEEPNLLTFESCQIYDNDGGFWGDNLVLTIANCEIYNNGDGVLLEGMSSELIMDYCLYYNNAGSIELGPFVDCEISSSSFANNFDDLFLINSNSPNNMAISECIVAHNTGAGLLSIGSQGPFDISCSNFYDNSGGNYVGIPDQTGINGNISEDPLFCDTASNDYTLDYLSPCAPMNNSCGVLMGAREVGCGIACGDINGDQALGVSDAVYLINYLFINGPAPYPMEIADVNCDGNVNLVDVIYIVNYVFRGGADPCDPNNDGLPDC